MSFWHTSHTTSKDHLDPYSAYYKTLCEAFSDRFVSKNDLQTLQKPYLHLSLETDKILKNSLKLFLAGHPIRAAQRLLRTRKIKSYLNDRSEYNQKFITKFQKQGFNVENHPLDAQQIEAVVACEDVELTLAPAGSGKTAALLGKVFYLIGNLHIPIDQILLIAFNRKVITELKDRCGIYNLQIETFHSLGNNIIKKLRADNNVNRTIIEEETTATLISHAIKILCKNPTYHQKYRDYLLRYHNHPAAPPQPKQSSSDSAIQSNNPDSPDQFAQTAAAFAQFAQTMINLQKSAKLTLSAMTQKISQFEDPYIRRRAHLWLELYRPIYRTYQKYLSDHGRYDFTDMINEATDLISASPKTSFPYRYILVDEAQDLSENRYQLIKALLDKSQFDAKLFAVGDDWQSINRFAGSDCALLEQFSERFQRETYRSLIERVYRFGDPVAKTSSKFIQKNPRQTRKNVKPLRTKYTDLQIRLNTEKPKFHASKKSQFTDVPPDYKIINDELVRLYEEQGEKLFTKSIQIISRYNSDIERIFGYKRHKYKNAKIIKNKNDTYEIDWQLESPQPAKKSQQPSNAESLLRPLRLSFCSMHKAKGMTRDIVFVINVNAGAHGIPSTRDDDPLVAMLLAKPDDFPYAEERRLFYVAVTRAKELTVVCADSWNASSFLYELGADLKNSKVQVCPKCQSGILIEHQNRRRGSVFYSCSNWANGCDYTET